MSPQGPDFMNRFTSLLLASVLLVVAFVAYVLFLESKKEGELANKVEWSVLQRIASTEGHDMPKGVRIERDYADSGYDVVGVPGMDGSIRWILANAEKSPRVKILPTPARLRLSKKDYDMIRSQARLNPEVDAFLLDAVGR
jgi:hypothetical protein